MKRSSARAKKIDPMTVVVILAFSVFTGIVGYFLGQAALLNKLMIVK